MTKQEKLDKVLELISKMEQNTFLLPDSWSDEILLVNDEWNYKTYVGTRGDIGRYINIVIKDDNNPSNNFEITFRNKRVLISDYNILEKPKTIDDVLRYIQAIYEEKHSFVDNAEGIKSIRKRIKDIKSNIKHQQKELKSKEQELKDALKLINSKKDD